MATSLSFDQKFILNNFDGNAIDTNSKNKAFIELLDVLESRRYNESRIKQLLGYRGLNFVNMAVRDRILYLLTNDSEIRKTLVNYMKQRIFDWKKFKLSEDGQYYANLSRDDLIMLIITTLNFETIISMMETMFQLNIFVRNNENTIGLLARRFNIEIFEKTWDELLSAYNNKYLNIRLLNSSMGTNVGLLKASKLGDYRLFIKFLDALPPDQEIFDFAILDIVKAPDPRCLYTILHRMRDHNLKPGQSYQNDVKMSINEFYRYDFIIERMKSERIMQYKGKDFFYYKEKRDNYHKFITTPLKIMFYNDLMSRFESDDSSKNPEILKSIQRLLE